MPHASYLAEVSWDGANIGQFVIGFSQLDGPDTFGQSFATRFDGADDDITNYVKAASWSRGRSSPTGPVSDGTGRLVLADPDGRFNPKNPDSPLFGKLKPLRPIRLTATTLVEDGHGHTLENVYPCFYHFIRSIVHNADPAVKETVIETIDLSIWLRRARPIIAAYGIGNMATAIGKVLDAIYWTEPAGRYLANGDDLPSWAADGSQAALDLITTFLLAIDPGGMFFIAGSGQPWYRDRHWLQLEASSATFDGIMSSAYPGVSIDTIENQATVTRTDGVPQTSTNPASSHDYAISQAADIESPLLNTDEQAAGLAAEITRRSGDPDDPLWDMRLINGDDDRLAQILGRELGDRVTVIDAGSGTDGDYILQSMSHDVTQAGRVHECSFGMTRRDERTPFVIGTSVLDGADQLIY